MPPPAAAAPPRPSRGLSLRPSATPPLSPSPFSSRPPALALAPDAQFGFSPVTGRFPHAGVALDAAGNPYGTTQSGGANGVGTAWRLTPNGGGGYLHQTLSSLGGPAGTSPYGGLAARYHVMAVMQE